MGMEKVIPPGSPSPRRSPQPPADKDKPLPEWPQLSRRSSSIYSDDSGYTKIIDLYTTWKVDDGPVASNDLQPVAYRETLTGLLARRFTEEASPASPLTMPHFPKHAVSIPSMQPAREDSPAASALDANAAPSFLEFSKSLQANRSNMVSSLSSFMPPPHAAVSHDTFWQPSVSSSPEFRAVQFEYEPEKIQGGVSQSITDNVKSDIAPPPLDLARSSGSLNYKSLGMLKVHNGSEILPSEQGSNSKFSITSSSESSFVVYTGLRESIRAIIRSKMGKKRSIQKGKEKVSSIASTDGQAPNWDSLGKPERRFSWVSSRKSSLQEGVTGILRSLSLTKSRSPSGQKPSSPRVRQKQLAIPLTPYQKYGMAVWHNSQRKKRRQARAARASQKTAKPVSEIRRLPTQNRQRNPRLRSGETFTAFQNGKAQILDALEETKQKVASTNTGKRRETMNKNLTWKGPGKLPEVRHRLFQSSSQRRRAKLKNSIALIGPVDPYVVEAIAGTELEEKITMPKNGIKLLRPLDEESTRQAEKWF
jgi:hypothetical protein